MNSTDKPMTELERRHQAEQAEQAASGEAGVRLYRGDGYVNMLNKYGTMQDSSEAYQFAAEPSIADTQLISYYEGNGLFAKIIDTPAEEALKHGFDLNLKDQDVESLVGDALDDLEWEENAATAIKWARLFGGSIAVMIIDDGRGLEDPLNWRSIRSVEEIRVFERAIVTPDYSTLYSYTPTGQLRRRGSGFCEPEYYQVSSHYGYFRVHESRCLIFRNGKLPENVSNSIYQYWGLPEYLRIKNALKDATISHSYATKMLERSVQAIYKMNGLSQLLATEDGENQVLKRLETIDLARGLLNSITVDKDGEEYDFKNFTFTGVNDVIEASCNMLSSLSNIPQTVLFGRSPAGENATGESDLENWYSFVEKIQKQQLKNNLRYLIDIILRAAVNTGKIPDAPQYKLEFSPLWSMSDSEQSTVDLTRAQASLAKAQTAQVYVDMQALDPSEVRKGLAQSEDFNVEDLVTEEEEGSDWGLGDDLGDKTVEVVLPGDAQPAQSITVELPDENADSDVEPTVKVFTQGDFREYTTPMGAPVTVVPTVNVTAPTSAATIVIRDGLVLTGRRRDNGLICGPGGHIEQNETPEKAARREAQEEFGICLGDIVQIGTMTGLPEQYGVPVIFVCSDYTGVPVTDGKEMEQPEFVDPSQIAEGETFPPFLESLKLLRSRLSTFSLR